MNQTRPSYWTNKSIISLVLWPLSLLFRLLAWVRRLAFHAGLKSSWRSPVPVVIIGNITAGGAGKTPMVIALSKLLTLAGYRIGVVSRGYGRKGEVISKTPMSVTGNSDPSLAGDEPVLIAARTGLPVVVAANRVAAVKHLIANHDIDCVLSDDGLQHYALERDIEIAVVDAAYGFGNRFCLPAGPLREPVSRLAKVDFVVFSRSGDLKTSDANVCGSDGHNTCPVEAGYYLVGDELVDVADETNRQSLKKFSATTVHAVAGIASPDKFFKLLHNAGITTIQHAFADHASYNSSDLVFDDDLPVLMTEKDMVKCKKYGLQNAWYLPVTACLDEALAADIKSAIEHVISKSKNYAD